MSENIMKPRQIHLEKLLTDKQIYHILKQSIGHNVVCELKGSDVKPAADGIAGFVGDHFKIVLQVEVNERVEKVHLFLKCLPIRNKPKADFIDENNFFRREMLMYELIEKIYGDDPKPWCVKAHLYTDSILVMPDLTLEGYTLKHYLETLDDEHVFIATTSIARFHAAFVNYETKKSIDLQRAYNTFQEFGHLLTETNYRDCQWLNGASKLSTNILKIYSTKPYRNYPELETKLRAYFLEACDSLKEYKNTINVLLHKDLWVNNIMFKYENGAPTSAVIIDYQNLRYGPPVFDLMSFMYLTTDRSYREQREIDIFNHYYHIFMKNLNHDSQIKVKHLGYDHENFLQWCEKGRMFGIFLAVGIYPYVLLDPKTAEKVFDDPETYEKYVNEDRTEPVVAQANKCEIYKKKNLDICEEFVESYLLKQL